MTVVPFVLAVVGAVLVVLFLLPGSTPSIDRRIHPHGFAVLEQVPVNDTRQWVLIRSENVTNPVVLFVHGGPGTSEMALNRAYTRALERYFTVVNWDQRGAGKSFAAGRDRSRMNISQFVDDVIDVSARLARRLHHDRIVLVGHSWGTVIGLLAVSRRPDLFSAYIGMGQVSRFAEGERLSYEWTLSQARHAADERSVRTLTRIGPPPYTARSRSNLITERRIMGKYGGEYHGSTIGALGVVLRTLVFCREYTMVDRLNFFRGIGQSLDALLPELFTTDLFVQVPEVRTPVYFCLGRYDYEVPSVLSEQYFSALSAPGKQLVWFEQSAHLPHVEEQDRFAHFMIDTVLPAVAEARV